MPKFHQKRFPPMGNRENVVKRAQQNFAITVIHHQMNTFKCFIQTSKFVSHIWYC